MNIMSLKKRSRLGFTLVELIVVIAILAILAGVAIPVYSNYVKKANEAADYLLLDSARAALATASMEHLVDSHDVVVTLKVNETTHVIEGFKNVKMTAEADKNFSIVGVKAEVEAAESGLTLLSARHSASYALLSDPADPADPADPTAESAELGPKAQALEDSFKVYFAENATTPLKTIYEKPIVISGDDTIVMERVADESGNITLTVRNSRGTATYTVSAAQVDAVMNSTFGTKMSMDELMSDVSGMVGALSDAMGGGGLMAMALTSNGKTLADWGVTAAEGTEEYLDQLSNAAVLLVASMVTEDTAANMMSTLSAGDLNVTLDADGLSTMAGLYGVATGFASSDEAADWSVTVGDKTYNAAQYYEYVNQQIVAAANSTSNKVQNIMNALGLLTAFVYEDPTAETKVLNSAFQAYSASSGEGAKSQLEKDIAGYVNAMQAVAANSGALVTTGAIEDGYDSGAISAILDMIFKGND